MVDRQQRRERRYREGQEARGRAGREYLARQGGGGSRRRSRHHRQLQGLNPMNIQTPRPSGHQSWEQVRSRLDQNAPFSNMYETPYYRDAVYDHFSKQEYQRRYAALREKMREHKLDCVIVPGGPSHWSFGGGMQWLTGHWEWHAIASYVVVPLDAEPTL